MALMTVEDEAAHRETEVTRATAIRAGVDDESRLLDVETVLAETVADDGNSSLFPRAILTAEDVEKMTVAQLRGALIGRGLAKAGNKPVLKARLLKAVQDGVTLRPLGSDKLYPNPEDGFDNTAHWVPLKPSKIPVNNPVPDGFHAPTNRTALEESDLYQFEETFDRAPWTETSDEKEIARGGKSYKKDGSGKDKLNTKVRQQGRPSLEWLQENNLTPESHPIEWLDALMTTGFTQVGGKKKRNTLFSQWTAWSNAKALLGNFADPDGQYPGFKNFKIQEIRRFIGLLILNGLNVSPRMEYKFKTQQQDPVNGNDLCSSVFGSNAAQRLREFRAAFAIQDPMLPIPSRKVAPNHKVDPLLLHMQIMFLDCWDPGPHIAGDEQDAGFQGRHPDKQRVTFKKEGDGFLIDALCDNGFTMTFYFRNMPAPAKWTRKGFCPTHARMLMMMEQLDGENFTCGMDNLFISVKFLRAALTEIDQKIQVHGVCRNSDKGLPSCVIQQEVTGEKKLAKARGTVKAAILKEDSKVKDLVAFSVFDSKPVHFLSTAATSLKWVKKTKKVYDPNTNQMRLIEFLRTTLQDEYNYGMNDVDIADQLRKIYCFNRWLRNRKWWWAIFLWALGVLVVNAYVCYIAANVHSWKKKKRSLYSHYEFRKLICLALLLPEEFDPAKADADNENRDDDSVTTNTASRSTVGRPKKRKATSLFPSTRSTAKITGKAPRVNERTLCPMNGDLRCRLVPSLLHLPDDNIEEQGYRTLKCALHRWHDRRIQKRNNILVCSVCRVSLCNYCYKKFHKVSDPVDLKKYMEKICAAEGKNKKT